MENNETKKKSLTLLFAAFASGLCSIIYELLIATTTSYFLGDSVTFFSLTIGLYMASMGVATFLSKYIHERLLERFIHIELVLALLGGLSVPLLYLFYGDDTLFLFVFFILTTGIGLLIGFEIPFLTRLMERYYLLKINIANILSIDYFGALVATLAFPFFLLPCFGIYQSSILFGLMNMLISVSILVVFKNKIRHKFLYRLTWLLTVVLVAMLFLSTFLNKWDQGLYQDRIIYSKQSRYQKIILTKDRHDVRLYLEGNLQFSSLDEYRYHEGLIDLPLAVSPSPVKRILLLGAGDGLAARNLLRYKDINEIIIVDLDKEVINLAKTNRYIKKLNEKSLESPRVHVVIGDAFSYLRKNKNLFDMIVADLPDPNHHGLCRLYSQNFYKMIKKNLSPFGIFVTQATSPYFAAKAFGVLKILHVAQDLNILLLII